MEILFFAPLFQNRNFYRVLSWSFCHQRKIIFLWNKQISGLLICSSKPLICDDHIRGHSYWYANNRIMVRYAITAYVVYRLDFQKKVCIPPVSLIKLYHELLWALRTPSDIDYLKKVCIPSDYQIKLYPILLWACV